MARVFSLLAVLAAVSLVIGCRPLLENPSGARTTNAERQRVASGLLAKVPPDATLSMQSDLLVYLGPNGSPYLFPVVGDADYVLADVASSPDPAVAKGLRQTVMELLDSGQFGILDGADGLLLLRRGLSGPNSLPNTFYDFLKAKPGQEGFVMRTRFGDELELAAYDYEMSEGELVGLTTYWRALRPLDEDYAIVFFLAPSDRGEPAPYEDASLLALWYPPDRWQSGELLKLDFQPALVSRDTASIQVVVYRQGQQGRLALPATLAGGARTDGAVQVLDLTQPPGEKAKLDGLIGLPFEASTARSRRIPRPQASPSAAPAALSLCGKPLNDPAPARLRPVAVKIDNAPAARPQVGLDEACVVYEHLAEGGITRFTAIYQTEETDVGPVRSARRVDLQIVPQYEAFFSHVGGAPAEMSAIRASRLPDVDQFFHSEAYYYSRQRVAPHNVFTSVEDIRSAGVRLGYGAEVKLEGFPFAEKAPEKGTEVTDILIPYLTTSQGEFRYDALSGDYLRFTGGEPHIDAGTGRAVRTKNIIVQRVPSWVVSTTEDPNGAASLDFNLVGRGRATVFRNGTAIEGTWVRESLEGWTRFYDSADQLIPLAPGKIWISLVSPGDRIVAR